MKLRVPLSVVLIALVLLIVSGCSKSGGGLNIPALKLIPNDAKHIACVDWKTLRTEPMMDEIYLKFAETMGGTEMEEHTGVPRANMEMMVVGERDNDYWLIITGNFNKESVRKTFTDNEMSKDTYKGVEIWTGDPSAAFIGEMLVFASDIKEVVDAQAKGGNSVYDNKDYKAILNKLPGGVFTFLTNQSSDNSLANGVTISPFNKNNVTLSGYYIFGSEDTARDNIDRIKSDTESSLKGTDLKASRQGTLVEITGQVSISNFIDSGFYGDIFE